MVYCTPCEDSPLSDHPRCVQVGIRFVRTADALEGSLVGAVALVDTATFGALPRCVARINADQRDTSEPRLISTELAKLPEAPVAKPCSLVATSGRDPFADAFQIFKDQSAPGALSFTDKHLRNDVVLCGLISPLFAGKFLQSALRGARAALLQAATALLDALSALLNLRARVCNAIAVGRQLHDAEINAEPVFGFELIGLGHIASSV